MSDCRFRIIITTFCEKEVAQGGALDWELIAKMPHQIHGWQEQKVKENLVKVEAVMEGDFTEYRACTAMSSSKGMLNLNRNAIPLLVIRRHPRLKCGWRRKGHDCAWLLVQKLWSFHRVDWKKLAIPNLALVSEGSWSTVDGMLLYMKVTLRLTLVIQNLDNYIFVSEWDATTLRMTKASSS